ncbi:hypothetical protein COLO4_32129 [Corchorus olitorius]|uniref:Zinc finger, BED-type n=1 Tax=Corchorus olitorius TaxID=93759 RepID=A0A1R3H109_9ROSI|nr:hypothetical protein COLO4_32129 [Corchorus olitorius]
MVLSRLLLLISSFHLDSNRSGNRRWRGKQQFYEYSIIEDELNTQPETQANPSGGSSAQTPTNATASSQNETTLSSSTICGKTDMPRAYVSESVAMDGKECYTCTFCAKVFKGGGIHRMKMYLASKKGEVVSCKRVPSDVRHRVLQNLKDFNAAVGASSAAKKRNYGSGRGIASYFPSGTSLGSQPTIKAALQSKER